MLRKYLLTCGSCYATGGIEFDDDGEEEIFRVQHCPFCGAEIDDDLEEDETDDEDEEF
jgi:hypothetical protein